MLPNSNNCTGCSACEQTCSVGAISIVLNENGFFRSSLDIDKCIGCKACEKVCPVLNIPSVSVSSKYFAAINFNRSQRERSSSGGIFSLLAENILEEGGVVYGALYDDNKMVRHSAVERIEDIQLLQGAKYSQSILGNSFSKIKEELTKGRKVLFAGTPCQIAGLKAFLKKEYDNLLLIDFICHGVPSPEAWKSYLNYRKQKDGQNTIAKEINLRSKETGWSLYNYSVKFRYNTGYEYQSISGEDEYLKAFINNLIIGPACNSCLFKGMHRCSDITLGDFWGIWNLYPDMDDNKGTSAVCVHSKKGDCVWQQISGNCKTVEVCEEDISRNNPSIKMSAQKNDFAEDVCKSMSTMSFENVIRLNKNSARNEQTNLTRRVLKALSGARNKIKRRKND